ncbi:MAG: MBL fold metallo-hydrolase [Clostridiales bacterium]|nr:MBL fold metallo-hydrolase [Clostridiales bacterium]
MKHDRFNVLEIIKRVTGGPGGEVYLIIGDKKTAVIDCGMSYCANKLIENIKRELPANRTLDYIMVSHSHYDHMGGLPYLKQAWPSAIAVGSEYTKYLFEKPSTLSRIRQMSKEVEESFLDSFKNEIAGIKYLIADDYSDDYVKIDKVVKQGDQISLGDEAIEIHESPGHTNCSLSFYLMKSKVLFPAETIGHLNSDGIMLMAILKSYKETIDSIEKAEQIDADYIVSPHYGFVPEEIKPSYFDLAIETAEEYKDFILGKYQSGLSEDEILDEFIKVYWHGHKYNQQPFEAFRVNAYYSIRAILNEFADTSR